MNSEEVINDLKQYCKSIDKEKDGLVFKSFQVECLDGYFGAVINHSKRKKKYEVFSYLKNKVDIAVPLCLKKFSDVDKAVEYFNEILFVVNSKDVDEILKFCKKS